MRLRVLLLCVLPALPAWPQAPAQGQPEVVSHEAPVTFSTRVNLVSVPVVVRDREGRAIGSLKQEDFQLFDKGKLQVISKFSVEKTDAPVVDLESAAIATPEKPRTGPATISAALPERYVAYLFDDVHLDRGDLLQTRQAVNRHLDESLESTSRAAIFTTSGRMLSDFTDDREKLHKAINSILPYSSGLDPEHDCPTVSYYLADLLVNKLLVLSPVMYTDAQLYAMISSGQADQALIAVVSEAEACMGKPSSLSEFTNLIIQVRLAAQQALRYGDRDTTSSLNAVRDVVRRISAMPGSRSIVLASPGFLLTRDHRSDEYDLLDRAIHANVTVNTIDMRGLYTNIPGGDASHRGSGSSSAGFMAQAEASAASQADDVLSEIADGTGGTFFHNDNGLKEGLKLLAARPEYVYVLGFSPQNLKFDGSFHGLKVVVRNSASLTLQVRRGYWAPNHKVDPAEEAREEIKEAVFSRDEIQDIPVDIQTEFFKSSDVKAELTIVARVNLKGLHFRKADDRNNDTVTLVAGLFDRNGNFVAGIQKVMEMRLRDQTLEAIQNSGISVKESFSVAPGRYVVRVVVRDSEGQTMAARNGGVEIP